MLIENTEVFGFRAALRGMRNPKNSWHKSDSRYGIPRQSLEQRAQWNPYVVEVPEYPLLGENDLKLALSLISGGSEHRKFLRMITISMDITIPRYVWQELDTYKVCTVRNSCSTMHKLGHTKLEADDFEGGVILPEVLNFLNSLGKSYRDTKDYNFVRVMKNHTPESFLQKATYHMNYETAITMFKQRWNHRLSQWRAGEEGSICNWILMLPYMKDFLKVCMEEKTWEKIWKRTQKA